MTKKSEEIHALLNIIGENKLDMPSRVKNYPRYEEAKQAILLIADVIWDSDENAEVNIAERGTAISMHVESSFVATKNMSSLCSPLEKATGMELFPTPSGIGACIVFDGVFMEN